MADFKPPTLDELVQVGREAYADMFEAGNLSRRRPHPEISARICERARIAAVLERLAEHCDAGAWDAMNEITLEDAEYMASGDELRAIAAQAKEVE